MNNFSGLLGLVLCGGLLLGGCASSDIPDEILELDYLDEKALENPEEELTYSEINEGFVHDFIKENRDKAVRWTATVTRVENSTTYELQEHLLPAILFTLNEEPAKPLQVGEVVTITGVLTGYGETFGKDPIWVVRPARLVETSEEEQKVLEEYQQSVEKAKEGADLP